MSLSEFLACDISNDFGISIDYLVNWVATTPQYTARFNVWLGDDRTKTRQVLETVAKNGMSPALFVAKELAEGYSTWGGGLGWHNHTYPQGNWLQDADFVSRYTVNLDGSQHTPSWIDAGNPVDCVPASVKAKGNAEYASWGNQCIGKKYCAMTAAATWGTWYPAALSASVNGIANYANPIQQCYDKIFKEWGGTINGKSVGTGEPSGSVSGNTTTTISMEELRKNVKEAIKDVFDRNINIMSKNYASNGKIMITKINDFIDKADIDRDVLEDIISTIKDVTVDTSGSSTTTPPGSTTPGASSADVQKIVQALDTLQTYVGRRVGDGQCYALSGFYAWLLTGKDISYSNGHPMLPLIGDGTNAHNIMSGWDWNSVGAKGVSYKGVVCPTGDIKVGDIYCLEAYHGVAISQYGHTGVIKEINGNTVVTIEQNYEPLTTTNHSYNLSEFATWISGLVHFY